MRIFFKQTKNLRHWVCGMAVTMLLLFCNYAFSQEKRGEKITVTKSATVDLKSMEAWQKANPEKLNEHRIGGFKEGETDGDEEGEAPKMKVPKNAKIMADPFGKMQQANVAKPVPGTQSSADFSQITTFNGIDDINSVIPPDVGGQVGPNHVMTTLNSFVRIANRAGAAISTVSLNAFFASLGNPSTFDPKLMYDPYNSRWIITACANAASASSAILVGVSLTNDPTGAWKLYSIDVDATNVNWFDYPSIGFNKNWVVVGGNMFSNASNSFAGGKLFVFNKSDLYASAVSPGVTVINAGNNGFTLVPAITYDNSISTMYLTQNFNGNSGGNGFIGFYTITGAIGAEVLSGTTFVSTPNPWASGASATNSAPQAGTANKVANNDARMQKTIYRNGSIWCTHPIFLPAAAPTRTAVQWWQLTTAGGITQRGRIDDATGTNFYAFPSIDVNQNNDAMIGCAKFSATTFPSACYAVRMATDAANTFQADVVYKAGQASYFKTFGGSSNRWGDYTSVCVDPNNDMDFWTVQEYSRLPSAGNDLWGTFWAGVCIPPPTPGSISGISPANAGATGQVFSVAAVSGATSYTWTFPAGCVITAGLNTNSVTVTLGNTSGTVSVIANKGTCSSAAQTFVLTINAFTPVTAAPASNGPLCPGSTLNLFANPGGGLSPYTFSWTGPNGFTSTLQNPSITSVSLVNAGSYSVTVRDNQSPSVLATASTTVVVNATSTSSTNLTICQSALPFAWNGTTLTDSGTVVVHFTNSVGCDSAATLILSLYPSTPVSFTNLAPIYNIAAAAVTLTGSPSGGTFTGPGISGSVFTPSSAGAGGPYTITYSFTDGNGCVNVTSQQTTVASCAVTGTPGAITTVGGVAAVCPGDSKSYSIAAVAGATYYTWTPPTGATIATGQGTTLITINYNLGFSAASGVLSVVANNACGFSARRSLTIKRNTAATPSMIVSPVFGVCNTSGVGYSVTNVAGRTFNWSFNTANAQVATGQGSNAITANFLPGYVSGVLSVTATNGCGTSVARLTTIRATLAAPAAITGSATFCANQVGAPYSIAAIPGAVSYYWVSPTGSHVSDGATTSASTSLTTTATAVTINFGATAGNVSVRANNACGAGAYKSLPVTIACFAKDGKEQPAVNSKTFNIVLSPNPSSNQFTLTTHSMSKKPVFVRVLDAKGGVVNEFNGQPEQTFKFGEKLMDGIYLVEVRQGENVKTIKAVKGK